MTIGILGQNFSNPFKFNWCVLINSSQIFFSLWMEIQYKSWLSLPNFIVTILYVIVVAHFQAADQFPSTPRWENMAIMAHNTRWLLFEILVLFTHQIIKRTPNMVLNCSCGFLFAIYNWSQMSTKLNRPEKSKHFNERKSFIKENCS